MNAKLNVPAEVDPRTEEFSLSAQWRVNHWAYVAIILSFAGEVLKHVEGAENWPVGLRGIIALAPLVPALLWLRSFRRWLAGMDELDRQITLNICLFAVSATLYLDMAVNPLRTWDVVPKHWWLLSCYSWWFQSVLLTVFYLLGTKIFNRRFQ